MGHDEHSLFREELPAYALGALDAEEIPALEAHLRACDSCRGELEEYRAVGEGLLAALPPRQPSAALRTRLQGRLAAAQRTARPQFTWSVGRLAFGIALAVLLFLNLAAFTQLRGLQRQQASLLEQLQDNQAALAMLSYPGTQSLAIEGEGVSGRVLLDRERNSAVLVAWNLPVLTEEQIYQIWLIEPDGKRVSAGLFRSQEGEPYTTEPVFSDRELSNFVGMGVTVEPAGGSDQPTGPRLFKVDF